MKIICVDFDGVLNSYTSGWQGPTVVPDSPVPGAIEWLCELCRDEEFQPAIYSSRSRYHDGILAIKRWLGKHGFPQGYIDDELITFPTQKPAAFIAIDDRGYRFSGRFPSLDELRVFKPWNKGGEMEVEEAVRVLTSALRDDPDFYHSYQSNIAVAVQDIFDGHVSPEDVNRLSNEAAKRFMSWWGCGSGADE